MANRTLLTLDIQFFPDQSRRAESSRTVASGDPAVIHRPRPVGPGPLPRQGGCPWGRRRRRRIPGSGVTGLLPTMPCRAVSCRGEFVLKRFLPQSKPRAGASFGVSGGGEQGVAARGLPVLTRSRQGSPGRDCCHHTWAGQSPLLIVPGGRQARRQPTASLFVVGTPGPLQPLPSRSPGPGCPHGHGGLWGEDRLLGTPGALRPPAHTSWAR